MWGPNTHLALPMNLHGVYMSVADQNSVRNLFFFVNLHGVYISVANQNSACNITFFFVNLFNLYSACTFLLQ